FPGLLVDLLQILRLRPARPAPGPPDIDHDHISTELRHVQVAIALQQWPGDRWRGRAGPDRPLPQGGGVDRPAPAGPGHHPDHHHGSGSPPPPGPPPHDRLPWTSRRPVTAPTSVRPAPRTPPGSPGRPPDGSS